MDLAEAVAAYTAGVDALLAADVDTPPLRELVGRFAEIETQSRRVPMVEYSILARLDRDADPKDLGAKSLWALIARRCRLTKGDAQRRIRRAMVLAPRRTFQGQRLEPVWEHTAAAVANGAIGADHVTVIAKTMKILARHVDDTTCGQAEQTLAEVGRDLNPTQLEVAANHLLALLHPDGELSDDEAARKVGLTLGTQQPDGTSYLKGWISPTLRALLEPVIAKFAQRNRRRNTEPVAADENPFDTDAPPPEDDWPTLFDDSDDSDGKAAPADNDAEPTGGPEPTRDPEPDPPAREPLLDHRGRTKAQFAHDAIAAGLEMLLRSKSLGTLNGLPTTIVVTTTLAELTRGAGFAVTAGGTRIPMPHLIELAARGAYHYLEVFDDHTGEIMHLGRAKRCATGAQKLALFGRDRGCTAPGCDVPFYDCQAHHGVDDWKHDGQTNVDDLALACGPENRLIEDTDWETRRREDGRFEWIPPPHLDYGQPRINNTHHPDRLLRPSEDDAPGNDPP